MLTEESNWVPTADLCWFGACAGCLCVVGILMVLLANLVVVGSVRLLRHSMTARLAFAGLAASSAMPAVRAWGLRVAQLLFLVTIELS